MNVRRSKDSKLPKVFEHKVADVRGGVGVAVDELGDDYLLEGTPISRPENGLCHVVKTAEITEALTAEATEVKVKKFHHFKEDDFVMLTVGAKAVKVTKVNRKAQSHDIITLESALGQAEKGKHLLLAKAAAESNTSELKYTPLCPRRHRQKGVARRQPRHRCVVHWWNSWCKHPSRGSAISHWHHQLLN